MAERAPLRVLVLGMNWPPETFLARLLEQLIQAGVEITVASESPPEDSWRLKWLYTPSWKGSLVLRLFRLMLLIIRAGPRRVWGIANRLNHANSRRRLQALNRQLPIAVGSWDVVYIPWNLAAADHLPLFADLPVVLSCRGSQVNVAPHDPQRPNIAQELRTTFQNATVVHCVSTAIMEEGRRYGLDANRARVIRPAVDPDFFRPDPDYSARHGGFSIVTTGSLNWRKGYEYALLGVRHLIDRKVPARFEIIGWGPDRERLVYTIRDLGLGDHVTLLGRLTPDQVLGRLQAADVFLLASLSEGISNAVLEAMACGLPVVTTECGGMAEAVRHGVEGFLVPPRDPVAITDALETLYHDPLRRRQLGLAARERIVQQFRLDEQGSHFLDLFREAATAGHAGAGPRT